MRTRNADAAKSVTQKKTLPTKKSATKSTPDSASETATPKIVETKRSAAAKAKLGKNNEATITPPVAGSDSKSEQSTAEEANASIGANLMTPESIDANLMTPETKVTPRKKIVKKVVKVVRKTPAKAKTSVAEKAVCEETPKIEESVKVKDEEIVNEEVADVKGFYSSKNGEPATENVGKFIKKEEDDSEVGASAAENVMESIYKGKAVVKLEEPEVESEKENQSVAAIEKEQSAIVEGSEKEQSAIVEGPEKEKTAVVEGTEKEQTAIVEEDPEEDEEQPEEKQTAMDVVPSNEVNEADKDQEPMGVDKEEEAKLHETNYFDSMKNKEIVENKEIEAVDKVENIGEELRVEERQPTRDAFVEEDPEEYDDRLDFEDHGDDDFVEDDPEEPVEEDEAQKEEQKELTAVSKERKIKKEYEIFVGGLDKEVKEEDVRRVFERMGEVDEVRLHMNLSPNKKGYAFVKFANKEHAKRALSEMKNPVICGKRCGTAPSEDNDTLFLGNICNTWTKEAIRQKLKEYGVEGVESITLVSDVQQEGRSRGFAFLEFSCHANAMYAYKRLQKQDVVFGHAERTAKVAFAEPVREPDPEVMANVKTIFLDGLPPYWHEDRVREHLKGCGEIVRVVLARNMSTAKRKDFGFVDFSSHEAAIACIEKINNTEVGDGNSKMRVKARLSNPMPKTQAVKGGMCGGFPIDRAGSGTPSRFSRSFGRGGHHFNWSNFPRGRGYYTRGRGHSNRMGPHEYDFDNRYDMFPGRPMIGRGGRRGNFRGGYHPTGRGVAAAGPSRTNFSRPWFNASERGHGDYASSRVPPFSPEAFDRPYIGTHFDDPYFYEDGAHGMKRPFYMTHHDPDYAEPSRSRPRLDYNAPSVPFRGTHYHDNYEAGGDPYSHGYHGPEYSAYPPYYRNDHPYGRGYYY